ncbi:unnamed protein product [Clonostachys rosea]|uniref:Xylanolytic transcriptional activator regulatory domain-containing protein n=1 Tax=Bionectria ochroleuca TaxID=29856 RepID=A0ABY6TRI2_BIOOC|nr:unnamed protein product [Clonostachys rosea]
MVCPSTSYVQSLEERVALLESKLRDAGATAEDTLDQRPSTTAQAPSRTSEAAAGTSPETASSYSYSYNAPNVIATGPLEAIRALEQRGTTRPEVELSKLLLRDLLLSRHSHHRPSRDQQEQPHKPATDLVDNLNTGPVTLPAQEVAGNLTKEFFLCANLGMPLLHEPTFMRKLALVYEMPHRIDLAETHTTSKSRFAVFFVLEVFAVALLTMQKQDPARIPTSVADRYHQGALSALMEAGLPEDVEGVQALLLIGQFYYFHPTLWTVWNTVGAAFRLAVELGLHLDPATPDSPDPLTLDTRRRTFWVAYSMDRNISISQGLPTCLSDGAIDVKFPSEVDDHLITTEGIETTDEKLSGSKLVSIHLFKYRRIQSEMREVLNEKPPPPYRPVNVGEWQQRMRDRINMWLETTPRRDRLNARDRTVTETFELTYHAALVYLYCPSPNNPEPSGSQLVAMTQSAIRIIQLYRKFFLEKKLTIYWQAVNCLYSAGTALMYGYVTSAELREFIGFRSFESTLHACSSVLWGMVERFPTFQFKRDAFDVAVSAVLADLNESSQARSGIQDSPAAARNEGTSPEHSQPPWFASGNFQYEQAVEEAQTVPSVVMDLGDLTMLWEATENLSGTPASTWI